ncbi:MAG: hypothetical protein AB7V48_15705 [Sedimentibacter sp.]
MYDSTKPYKAKNNTKKFNTNNDDNIETVETGFINVIVHDATTGEPIENAKIEIMEMRIYGLYHESGYGNIIETRYTDSNGQVAKIELPTNFEEEDIFDAYHEHINYHMMVSKEGYCNIYITNILIYNNITNLYRVNLWPSNLGRPQYEFIITPVIP